MFWPAQSHALAKGQSPTPRMPKLETGRSGDSVEIEWHATGIAKLVTPAHLRCDGSMYVAARLVAAHCTLSKSPRLPRHQGYTICLQPSMADIPATAGCCCCPAICRLQPHQRLPLLQPRPQTPSRSRCHRPCPLAPGAHTQTQHTCKANTAMLSAVVRTSGRGATGVLSLDVVRYTACHPPGGL